MAVPDARLCKKSAVVQANGTALLFFCNFWVWFDEKYGFLLVSVAILAII